MSTFFATWSIENFSMCSIAVGEPLLSPKFRIPEVGTSEWNIRLYPKGQVPAREGDHLSIFVEREDRDKEAEITKFFISFIVVNSNWSSSVKFSENFEIKYDSYLGYKRLIFHDELYKDSKRFLPNDTLTVRVGISPRFDLNKNDVDPSTPVENLGLSGPPFTRYTAEECFSEESGTEESAGGGSLTRCSFLTRIPVERRVLKWKIKEFSVMRRLKEKASVTLESQLHRGIKLLLQCYVDGSSDVGEILTMDILRKGVDFRRTLVKCKITFLDSAGADRCLKTSEHVFGNTYTRWTFPVLKGITANLIKDDAILMNCEFSIAYEPQNVEKFITSGSSSGQSDSSSGQSDSRSVIEKILELEAAVVRLVCKDDEEKEFEVHRVLLCAMSPVFQAMFSSDNLEKQTGVVRMDDVGASTVQYLKDYLYSESVSGNLQTCEALKLYATADKYQMEDLKSQCAALLKSDICLDNVCEMIEVADMYQDPGLKEYILDFLVKEMDFDSDRWSAFKKVNATLAAETMRKCLVEKEDRK